MKTDPEEKLRSDAHKFWNLVDTNPINRRYSHWRNHYSVQTWYGMGKQNLQRYLNVSSRIPSLKNEGIMLEWGCGGGTNVHAFSKIFQTIIGVDVSRTTLNECYRKNKDLKIQFIPVLINLPEPSEVFDYVGHDSCNFVLSTACFHHFPSKLYTKEVLEVIFKLLKKDSLAIIQYRWHEGGWFHAPKFADYCCGKNAIRFTSFGICEFTDLVRSIGFEVLRAIDLYHAGCNFCYLRK